MTSELTNLLPPERQSALARDYTLRLAVVSVWFISALTFVALLLLFPTYMYLSASQSAKQAYLSTVESTASSSDAVLLTARLSALSASVAALKDIEHAASASSIFRQVLVIPRPGISLTGFAFTPSKGSAATLVVSGNALTRDALRNYQIVLAGSSFVKSADLPVSAYAQDSNIGFTITITLAP